MKNILIINQPLNNRGDEAAHRSLIRSLNIEIKDTHINIVDVGNNPDSLKQMCVESYQNTYTSIPVKLKGAGRFLPKILTKYALFGLAKLFPFYFKYIKILKEADIVINAPGGICMGGFQSWTHIFYLTLALKYNKNVFYYGRSIGPFPDKTINNRIFRKRSLSILQNLKFISIRDNKSMQIADQLGINYISTVDTAFLDIPDVSIPSEIVEKINGEYIVFVPNSLTWHPDFNHLDQNKIDNLYLTIFDYLMLKYPKCKIVLLPQLFNSYNPDYDYFCKLDNLINNKKVIVLPETISSDLQQKIIKQSKLVIGARYHSIVFAINNQVPVVSLSYEHKMDGLLEILNISGCNIDFRSIVLSDKTTDKELINIVENALSYNYDKKQSAIEAKIIAQTCFDKMIQQLH